MEQSYFRIGAVGMILVAITVPIYFAIWLSAWLGICPWPLMPFPLSPFFALVGVVAIIMSVGFILGGVGFFGYYKMYNLRLGVGGFLVPILFSWTLFILEVDYLGLIPPFFLILPGLPFGLTGELLYWVLKDAFLAFVPILWSITVFQVASHTGDRRRTLIGGVILLVSGLAYFPQIILDLYGPSTELLFLVILSGTTLLCVATVFNSIVFLKTQTS